MIITNEVLQGLDTNINVTWKKRFESVKNVDLWKKIAEQFNSKHASENIAWLGAVPGLREFKDERKPGKLTGYSYSIDNKKWESTLDVERDFIEDDRTGEIMRAVSKLAAKAGKHYTKLVSAAFDAGFSTTIFDGQNFFDADHETGSNYLGTNKAIDATNVAAAEKLLNLQKDDKGEYLDHAGTHIICGPENAAAAEKLVTQKTLANGEDNTMYKKYEVVVLPNLGTSTAWALADLGQGEMPFILQIRVAITLIAKTDLNSDRAFDQDIFTWGTRARHNAGYGNHQLIVGAKSGS